MNQDLQQKHHDFLQQIAALEWQEQLLEISKFYGNKASFATSFSIEDQIITHEIATQQLDIEVFTLDTGRLFEETYKLWQETIEKYNITITPYCFDNRELQEFLAKNGPNSFYNSKELRLKCCDIRKIQPLKIALKEQLLWLSGIRAAQSAGRNDKMQFEFDAGLDIFKFYPILKLSDTQIWDFIKQHKVPYNSLYDKGFTSIGCAPCTRANSDPNDPRSGRWWWENDATKECGLHMVDGKLTRKKND